MSGVPWELSELPRQLHPNPVGDIFGEPPVRKQRSRKPKGQNLDTIAERPAATPQKRVPYQQDASTSTTDLDGLAPDGSRDDAGAEIAASPKKVMQRGQINTLAKMLSALRR